MWTKISVVILVLVSGISIYVLVFVLEADILSTCCNKDDVI